MHPVNSTVNPLAERGLELRAVGVSTPVADAQPPDYLPASPPSWKKWVCLATANIAFFFAAFSRVAPSGLVSDLRSEFGVSGALLGTLGAEFYYLYVLCQLPIGVAISRYGVRRVLMAFQGIQLVGTLCFALAPSLVFLHVGRILIGLGSSVTFIGFVTVIKQWFPPQWGGGLMGASITCGVTGASVAQSPLSTLAGAVGWRAALLSATPLVLVVLVLAACFMDDFGPMSGVAEEKQAGAAEAIRTLKARAMGNARASTDLDTANASVAGAPATVTLWEQWRIVRSTPQIWVAAFCGCMLNACTMSFMGLWATPFFKVKFGISTSHAGLLSSAGFWGNAVTSPFIGALSDRVHAKRRIAFWSLFTQGVAMSLLIFADYSSEIVALVLTFLVGAGTNINVLLNTVRKYLRVAGIERTIAMAGGVMNASFLASPIIIQPVVGAILDARRASDGAVSTNDDYKAALLVFPVCTLLGCVSVLCLKTSSKSIKPPSGQQAA